MVKKNGAKTRKSLKNFYQDVTLRRFISVDIHFCEDERLYGFIVADVNFDTFFMDTFVHGGILKLLWNLFLQLPNMQFWCSMS